jgi:hypothetical protein
MIIGYQSAPNGFGDVWQRYLEHGLPPGSFGRALLCNDLTAAVLRADPNNKRLLGQHVEWLWNHFPLESWGNEAKYNKVISDGGYEVLRAAPRMVGSG